MQEQNIRNERFWQEIPTEDFTRKQKKIIVQEVNSKCQSRAKQKERNKESNKKCRGHVQNRFYCKKKLLQALLLR